MSAENTLKTPILVLGATSLIGTFLMARLQAAGHEPMGLSRRPPGGDACWIDADLRGDDLAEQLPGAATVFALSPIWLLPDALPALKARGMTRLVAFSSTSRFTKEASPEASERAVAKALADAENAVEAFGAEHGIAWTILRPTLIYAEGRDGNVSRLAGLIRRFKVLPLSGTGEGLRQPVHADDLAAGAIAAATAPAASNRAYALVGGETLAYRDMVRRIYEGLGRTPLIAPLPPWLFSLLLTLARPFFPGATAAMGARMSQDLVFDAADAVRDFGWSPRDFHPRF
ncbi:NAD-dependent epimerase/dehydratase family protein [Caulobacter hibisci]|uniref:NAD-dependent epimerase/dehydratase family protein n=1 Tax=Caulobacter hibisci TaxID=2035993 RepID=A0ABS0T320_9CAUL|nr:NAD-dependent epimerase/dehydratase family protein [Caulobacter hibisci]MBI1686277.1 NAD-dependent epimerase/dehydratase family protein [Caulobacter hibisci]